MAAYRYFTADLLTGNTLADLPLNKVRFDSVLNGAGAFTGDLPLTDDKVKAISPIAATEPTRTALYVDRDGVLLWGGIIWDRDYDSETGALVLSAEEFWSYFGRRRISASAVFTAVDQLAIVQSLLNTAQAATSGNIGITIGTETSGVTVNRTYDAWSMKTVRAAVEELASADAGFDFAVDVAYAAGVPTKTFRLGYPRRGAVAASSGWLWELGGNMLSYTWAEKGSQQAIRSWATGGGTGAGSLIASATTTSQLDAGYPLVEDVTSYVDIADITALTTHAVADGKALAAPVVVPVIRVAPTQDPYLGSYSTGDEARIRITDDRFPAPATGGGTGLDVAKRIVRIEVTPPEGTAEEKVLLTLGPTV